MKLALSKFNSDKDLLVDSTKSISTLSIADFPNLKKSSPAIILKILTKANLENKRY
jgi:hypothetical protein